MNSDVYKLFHHICSYRIPAGAATLPCVVMAKNIFVAAQVLHSDYMCYTDNLRWFCGSY